MHCVSEFGFWIQSLFSYKIFYNPLSVHFFHLKMPQTCNKDIEPLQRVTILCHHERRHGFPTKTIGSLIMISLSKTHEHYLINKILGNRTLTSSNSAFLWKELTSAGDMGLIPGWGKSPGEGNGNPFQHSCLENSMDGGDWQATVHGIAKSWTPLSDFTSLQAFVQLWREGPRQQTGAWGKTAFHSAVSITLTSLSCLTLPSSLLVLKFQRLLFLYCSSPFARKRPGLSLSRSATIPSSRSLSMNQITTIV